LDFKTKMFQLGKETGLRIMSHDWTELFWFCIFEFIWPMNHYIFLELSWQSSRKLKLNTCPSGMYFHKLHQPEQKFTSPKKNTKGSTLLIIKNTKSSKLFNHFPTTVFHNVRYNIVHSSLSSSRSTSISVIFFV
jgi:hypothetical protein